ncbi:MAG: hypothetical protein QNK23_03925 [Crocinitomicaceae bacterium]|nr:hypothetical protein [Crocinitomicaceae bacterium]
MHANQKQRFYHYGLLTLVCILLYSGVFSLGFFSDDFQGIERYKQMGYGGMSDNYNNPFFMPISFWVQLTELRLFGENYFAIKCINLILFSSTALSIYHLSLKIGEQLKLESSLKILAALGVSLLFICSPYQTEAINWFASQAYLLSTLCVVLALNLYLKYRSTQKPVHFAGYLLLFFLALLNKEIAIITPLIAFGLGLLLFNSQHGIIKRTIGVSSVFVLYLFFRYLYLGELVGGYGMDAHLNFDFALLLSATLAYIAKFFLFYRYIPQELKSLIIIATGALLAAMIAYLFFSKTNKGQLLRVSTGLLFLFLVSLLPVLNLETTFLGEIQSDRYGYLPSVFFAILLVFPLVLLFKKHTSLLFLPLIVFSALLTVHTNQVWKEAATVRDNFISSVKELGYDRGNIIVNLPDTYEGIYLFRHGFDECLGFEITKNIRTLYSHALTRDNHIIHQKMDDGVIHVQIYKGRISPLNNEYSVALRTSDGHTVLIDAEVASYNSIYYFDNNRLIRAN